MSAKNSKEYYRARGKQAGLYKKRRQNYAKYQPGKYKSAARKKVAATGKVKIHTKNGEKMVTENQAVAYRARSEQMRQAWSIAKEAAKKYGGKPAQYLSSGTITETGEAYAGAVEEARREQNKKYVSAWKNFFSDVVSELRAGIQFSSRSKQGKKDAIDRLQTNVIDYERKMDDNARAAAGSYIVNSGNAGKIQDLLNKIVYSSDSRYAYEITTRKWDPIIQAFIKSGLDIVAKDIKLISAIVNTDLTTTIDAGEGEIYE